MSANWLSPEAYERLNKELEELKTTGRERIARQIADARAEGDLRENGGYHAAREEQSKQEARIAQLEELLRNAEIGKPPADNGVVEPGMVVEASIAGKTRTFLLGSREAAGTTNVEIFPENSPLGTAITGHAVGETVEYKAPNGKMIKVEILAAKPY